MNRRRLLASLLLAPFARLALAQPVDAVPGDSLYQLVLALEGRDGRRFGLDLHRGHPVLVSMFYGSCRFVCPALIEAVRRLEDALSPGARERLRVLLVSIDPAHDTPARLQEIAVTHRATSGRWTFARTEAGAERMLAAALGIRYRELPDGGFNHATVISLLDRHGRISRQTSRLAGDAEFLEALRVSTADDTATG